MALACALAAIVLHHLRETRTRRQKAEDIELLCDTAMRCVHIHAGQQMLGGHPRLIPDVDVDDIPHVDWDSVSVNPVPSISEIEDTLEEYSGDSRMAVFKLMERRGLDPDSDDDLMEWQRRVNGSA